MKCKYQLPHQPQKCGLLISSWNDPVTMLKRAATESAAPIADLNRMYEMLGQAALIPPRVYYNDIMIGIAVEFWRNYDIIVCDYHCNEWKHGEKIKEGDHG